MAIKAKWWLSLKAMAAAKASQTTSAQITHVFVVCIYTNHAQYNSDPCKSLIPHGMY